MFSAFEELGEEMPSNYFASPRKVQPGADKSPQLRDYIHFLISSQRALGLDSHPIFKRAGTTPTEAVEYVPLFKRRNNDGYDPSRVPIIAAAGVDYYIVIDYECTCDEPQIENHEIIEFPAVLVKASTLEIHSVFHSFVKPVENPILSQYCKDLTGIQQHEVDNAPTLPIVLTLFRAWLRSHGVWLPMMATSCANIISESVTRDDGSVFQRFVVDDAARAEFLSRMAANAAAAAAAELNEGNSNPTTATTLTTNCAATSTPTTPEDSAAPALETELARLSLSTSRTHGHAPRSDTTRRGKDGYGGGHTGAPSPLSSPASRTTATLPAHANVAAAPFHPSARASAPPFFPSSCSPSHPHLPHTHTHLHTHTYTPPRDSARYNRGSPHPRDAFSPCPYSPNTAREDTLQFHASQADKAAQIASFAYAARKCLNAAEANLYAALKRYEALHPAVESCIEHVPHLDTRADTRPSSGSSTRGGATRLGNASFARVGTVGASTPARRLYAARWDSVLVPMRPRGRGVCECLLSTPMQRVSNAALLAYCAEHSSVELEVLLALQRRALLHDYCEGKGWLANVATDAVNTTSTFPLDASVADNSPTQSSAGAVRVRGVAALAQPPFRGLTEDAYLSLVMYHHPSVSMVEGTNFPRDHVPSSNVPVEEPASPATDRAYSRARARPPPSEAVMRATTTLCANLAARVSDAVSNRAGDTRREAAQGSGKSKSAHSERGRTADTAAKSVLTADVSSIAQDGAEHARGTRVCLRVEIAGEVMTSHDNTAVLATDGPWDLGKFLVPECYYKRVSGLLCDSLGMLWQVDVDSGYFERLCYEWACIGLEVRRGMKKAASNAKHPEKTVPDSESPHGGPVNVIPIPACTMAYTQPTVPIAFERIKNTPENDILILTCEGETAPIADNPHKSRAPLLQAVDIRGHLRRLSSKRKLPFMYTAKNGFNVTSVLFQFCMRFQGREHCGLADTLNIARILMALCRHSDVPMVPNMQKALDESIV